MIYFNAWLRCPVNGHSCDDEDLQCHLMKREATQPHITDLTVGEEVMDRKCAPFPGPQFTVEGE
jgi:hypothetical protein